MDPVRFRDCACPGTPHDEGDTVTFRPRLSFDASVDALKAILNDKPVGNSANAWRVYLFEGPESWNLVDDDGNPVPLDRDALEALDFADQYEIADRADSVFGSQVLSPLVRRMKTFSGNGRTGGRSRSRGSSSPARR